MYLPGECYIDSKWVKYVKSKGQQHNYLSQKPILQLSFDIFHFFEQSHIWVPDT